ncbi:hypothetical protein F4V91_07975 [Neorhizobium galegae]|uniref:Uncharacterized protein n=1 Tax=Neorhizobium galegae TaxID=399 RepID=A0A6A1TNV4_NEOGA|nr:hypothetical protein [Neorhizobium galegae]KAB1086372.1 hypothetical protein F4V91_07975 [Neorhizobium galegae]
MKATKLFNLLTEIDTRLNRLEKSAISYREPLVRTNIKAQPFFALRDEVRRQLPKVDALREADVAGLERLIRGLQDFTIASPPLSKSPQRFDVSGFSNLVNGLRIGLSQLSPVEMLEAVPGQKTASFAFGFRNDMLTVIDQPLLLHPGEEDLARAALENAIEQGVYLNEDVGNSNASPRLKEGFARLQSALESRANIVQIGSRAQICNRLVNAELDELSGGQAGLMLGHIETVFRALAQFPQWRSFCENALSVDLDFPSVVTVAESAKALAIEVAKSGAVDPSVADALETVSEWATDKPNPDKRDVLSLVRTLENVWSAISKPLLSLGKEMVSQARKTVAVAVLGALIYTASQAIPIMGKVPGAEWVQTAYSYFKNMLPPANP